MELKIRQVIPLALLYAADDHRIEGRTRFQKLVFLLQEEALDEDIDTYEFIEYDYGPFAKEVLDDLERFESEGLVKIEKTTTLGGSKRYNHELTDEGVRLFEDLLEQVHLIEVIYDAAEEVIEEYNEKPLFEVLDHVYEEYPQYQEKSVIY